MFEKDNTAGLFTLYFTKQRISNDRHHTKCMFYDNTNRRVLYIFWVSNPSIR